MHVFAYVCVYVCIYTSIYVDTYMHIPKYAYLNTHMYTFVHVYINSCTHVLTPLTGRILYVVTYIYASLLFTHAAQMIKFRLVISDELELRTQDSS